MNILVIGSGGREHALVWKIAQSPKVKKIYCAPGNAGIAGLAECVDIAVENIPALLEFAQKNKIGLTVVGPEVPLSLGIVDAFSEAGLDAFGPKKNAAILEFSKAFTKEFCKRHNLPTAKSGIFTDASEAKKYLREQNQYPIVLKADGLAAGKGVVIATTEKEALESVDAMMVQEKFGDAGRKLVIEEFMQGEEATYMVVCDGENFLPLESAQDHKRAFDRDEGPNTGGMGAYSPAPIVTPAVAEKVNQKIIRPLLAGMKAEGRTYKGLLYAGLMIHQGEPRLVEFNCRFGDPEAQAILVRLESDLVDLMQASIAGQLSKQTLRFSPDACVCIVLASGGYPGSYENGKLISGLDKAACLTETIVFHAGTRKTGEGIVTQGGRVLGVTAKGPNLASAIDRAYKAANEIQFEQKHQRTDIGQKGLL